MKKIKGIILIKDFSLAEYMIKIFPQWIVLASNEVVDAIEFYPIPK